MRTVPESTANHVETARQRELVALLAAIAVAVVLERWITGTARNGGIPSPFVQIVTADLAVWIPLVAGALWVLRRASWRSAVVRLGLGWGDAVFAIGIVIVCRGVDAAMSIAFTGSTGLVPGATLGTPDVGLLLVSAIGVVIISPVLEEVVFRGLFQRRLADALTPRTRFLAVLLTAFLFALVHLFIGSPANQLIGFEVFVTTFLLGVLTGTLVAMTDRIGGAILAHVLFNAVAVIATWPR